MHSLHRYYRSDVDQIPAGQISIDEMLGVREAEQRDSPHPYCFQVCGIIVVAVEREVNTSRQRSK